MTPEEREKALGERRQLIEGRTERVWTKTDFEEFSVYKVPTELLVLNHENRRFRAEAQEVEADIGRPLDPNVDEESIIALLLDKDPRVDGQKVVGGRNKDTEALIADWQRRHQERPLWIRPDGTVSNGNRRLAMLKRLQNKQGATGYDWVDVVVMDRDTYDDETLFEMETREQLTEGFKVRYNKMNGLLTLRDAAEKHGIDWHDPASIRVVAELIQDLVGNNPNYARVQLQAVKVMTDYLNWIERPGEYSLLRGKVERFRDVGKNMEWLSINAPEHQPAMLELCFLAIQSGNNHPDIREIRRIVKRQPEAFESLAAEVSQIAAEDDQEAGEVLPPPSADEEGEDDDHEAEVENEIVISDGPTTAQQKRIFEAVNASAQASRAHGDPPETKLRTAAMKLAEVDPVRMLAESSVGSREQTMRSIAEVLAWAEIARVALEATEQTDG